MSAQENLEERIERIRKRNEELQKRHAEAEADKQRAKNENAMVQTKAINYDDWPREHKYDYMEFTFDKNNEINNIISDEVRDKKRERHNKSQFAEGDGPPPDPSYSFLKDADRDYNYFEQTRNKNNSNEKMQWTNQRNQQRSVQTRGSFKGNNRGTHKRGGDFPHSNDVQPAYDAWLCERNKIDQARINRQRNSEGKWRREWDVEKINNDEPNEICRNRKSEKFTMNDVLITGLKKSNNMDASIDKAKEFNCSRPNITVSLSRSGEVQSVKVSSPPAIGSGRVGPRQIKSRHSFSDDLSEGKNIELNTTRKSSHASEHVFYKRKDNIKTTSKQNYSDVQFKVDSSVQDRLHKFKKPKDFFKLSKELKCVSKEIDGICTSVENLNKKHIDGHQDVNSDTFDDRVTIDKILKNNMDEITDEYCLSTDLITEFKKYDELANQNKTNISETNLKCEFGNMGTADIENFIEQEVGKNCISFTNSQIQEARFEDNTSEDNTYNICEVLQENETVNNSLGEINKEELFDRQHKNDSCSNLTSTNEVLKDNQNQLVDTQCKLEIQETTKIIEENKDNEVNDITKLNYFENKEKSRETSIVNQTYREIDTNVTHIQTIEKIKDQEFKGQEED